MRALGHAAVGWITVDGWRGRLGVSSIVAILGALLPDLTDKTAHIVGLLIWSRGYGHNLIIWLLITMLSQHTLAPRWLRWFAWGGLSHLVADIVSDGVVGICLTGVIWSAWMFYPFITINNLHLTTSAPLVPLPHGVLDVFDGAITLWAAAITAGLCWQASAPAVSRRENGLSRDTDVDEDPLSTR